ncbi:MAG: helicase-related protein [Hyphomicrobium sp.]
MAFVGLQQRLLSSVPAFTKTLKVHRKSLLRIIEEGAPITASSIDELVLDGETSGQGDGQFADEAIALAALDRNIEDLTSAATALGAIEASAEQLASELSAVDAMLELAEAHATKPDARIRWLSEWIGQNMIDGNRWTDRRLIIFTEYEDTRFYIQRQLQRLLPDEPDQDQRIVAFTGITSLDRREAIKRAFNSAQSPLRILICTDAAREGINLQQQCYDLVHFDLPWNPSRLEQRNGRIDRKLQPAPQVFCRYFVYRQRPEDVVLDALVRKTDIIRRQLGSAGQVIENSIARRMTDRGIARADAKTLAAAIENEEADEMVKAAVRELGDEPDSRLARLRVELAELDAALNAAKARVGVEPHELEAVVGLALERAGADLGAASAKVGETPVYGLSPESAAFASDQSWQGVFDELRTRRIKPGDRPNQWRAAPDAAVRKISFTPASDEQGRDAADVVQVHVEHRLVRRLLSRFLTAGFQAGLSRACVIQTEELDSKVVLLGRLALYGPNATRLHEEIIPIAATWTGEAGDAIKPLTDDVVGMHAIAQLEQALSQRDPVPDAVAARFTPGIASDVAALRPALEALGNARRAEVAKELSLRGREEAASLKKLLQAQIDRIRAEQKKDDRQLTLEFDEQQSRQRAADRKSWEGKIERLSRDLEDEPERLRASFEIRAARIEPLGMVYLAGNRQG